MTFYGVKNMKRRKRKAERLLFSNPYRILARRFYAHFIPYLAFCGVKNKHRAVELVSKLLPAALGALGRILKNEPAIFACFHKNLLLFACIFFFTRLSLYFCLFPQPLLLLPAPLFSLLSLFSFFS